MAYLYRELRKGGSMSKEYQNRLSAAVVIIFTICIVHLVLAQPQSDNYILKKWAISSGGGSASSDNYQAVVVIGQSSPPGESSSENYTLFSGYLQPLYVLPGSALVWVWTDSANVYLDWDDVPNASNYNIYRSNQPDVTIEPGNLVGTSAVSSYTDYSVVADSTKIFYRVTCNN